MKVTPDDIVDKYLGAKYLPDGREVNTGFDCWGLCIAVVRDIFGVELIDPNWHKDKVRGRELFQKYKDDFERRVRCSQKATPRFGSLIAFHTPLNMPTRLADENISMQLHCGIYLKDNKMIHATPAGVILSDYRLLAPHLIKVYRID